MNRHISDHLAYEKKQIGIRLKRFAKSYFDSFAAMARALDIHPATLSSSYLSGRHFPGGELLIKLFHAGCDLGWLLTGEGLPPKPNTEELNDWKARCDVRYKIEFLRIRDESLNDAAVIEELVRNQKRFLEENPDVPSALRDEDDT